MNFVRSTSFEPKRSLPPVEIAEFAAAGVAEAAPLPIATPADALLTGDEIIQLSIKPSLWFIAFVSFRWTAGLLILSAALFVLARESGSVLQWIACELAVCGAMLRVGIGALQWASRLYVLTNRRVMRFRGVMSVDVAQCRLEQIAQVELRRSGAQPLLRLGTLRIFPTAPNAPRVSWEHVARPAEVERIVREAAQRSHR